MLDQTHDPGTESWVESANRHPDFPIQNLPFGVFEPVGPADHHGTGERGGIRIGDEVLDLRALSGTGLLTGAAQVAANAASAGTLNALFALGGGPRRELRSQLFALLTRGTREQDRVARTVVSGGPDRDVAAGHRR